MAKLTLTCEGTTRLHKWDEYYQCIHCRVYHPDPPWAGPPLKGKPGPKPKRSKPVSAPEKPTPPPPPPVPVVQVASDPTHRAHIPCTGQRDSPKSTRPVKLTKHRYRFNRCVKCGVKRSEDRAGHFYYWHPWEEVTMGGVARLRQERMKPENRPPKCKGGYTKHTYNEHGECVRCGLVRTQINKGTFEYGYPTVF